MEKRFDILWRKLKEIVDFNSQQSFLCFLILNEKRQVNFPPEPEDVEAYWRKELDTLKTIAFKITENEAIEEAENIFDMMNNIDNDICELNIRDKKSFATLSHYFSSIGILLDVATKDEELHDECFEQSAIIFWERLFLVSGKYREALGYWISKQERSKTNRERGGRAQEIKGEKNKMAIINVMKKYDVKSGSVFKKDSDLRKRFMNDAKQKTSDLSEGRIMAIIREIELEDS